MNTISCLGFASKNNPRESSEKQRGGIDESMLTMCWQLLKVVGSLLYYCTSMILFPTMVYLKNLP